MRAMAEQVLGSDSSSCQVPVDKETDPLKIATKELIAGGGGAGGGG